MTVEGWDFTSEDDVEQSLVEGVVHLTVTPREGSDASVTLSSSLTGSAALRCEITSQARNLGVHIYPDQGHAYVESLTVGGDFEAVHVSAPVWPYDPTELGTAELKCLEVSSTRRLTLGGDDLLIGSLEVGYPPPEPEGPSELEDDTAWDKIVILEDSLVRLEKPPPTLPLHMRERARLVIGGTAASSWESWNATPKSSSNAVLGSTSKTGRSTCARATNASI